MIKGIIFDLGNTLLKFTGDWPTVRREGAAAMADWYLKKKHVKIDPAALIEAFLAEIAACQQQASQTQTEVQAQDTLRRALAKIDAPAAATAHIEAALKIYFGPEEAASQPYPDAVDTLKKLSLNYRLGLCSNAADDPLIQRLVNQGSLRPWLSPTFSSAGLGWRKPRPEPFQLIASRWELSPAEIVVVGDTLAVDILGAHNAGMASVLVTMDESATNAQHRDIKPSATASSLSALLDVIVKL